MTQDNPLPTPPATPVREVTFRLLLQPGTAPVVTESSGAQALLGYSAEDFLSGQTTLSRLIHPDDQDIAETLFSPAAQSSAGECNLRFRHASGRILCVKAHYRREPAAAGLTLELRLQDARSLLRTLPDAATLPHFAAMMENTDDYIYFKDRNHVFTGASQTLVSICSSGEKWTDLLGQTGYDVFPEEHADDDYRLEKQVFAGLPVAREEQEIQRKDGTKGWVDNRKYPIHDASGALIGLYGIARDITSQKQTEQALRANEERWRFAVEGSGAGHWDWDVASGAVHYSKAWAETFGFKEGEIEPTLYAWRRLAHPDDVERVLADVQAHFDGRTSAFATEYRVRCKDGTLKWVLGRGLVVERDAAGHALRMVGANSDITAQKQQEADLRQSREAAMNLMEDAVAASERFERLNRDLQVEIAERTQAVEALRLNATALASISQGVLITGRDRLILSANQAFTAITGYSEAESLGRNCKFLQGPESAPATISAIRSALKREVDFTGEILNYRKDGTPFWNELTITPARNAGGEVTHFVGITRDVTERIHAQEKLLSAHRLFTKLTQQVPGVVYQYRLYPDGRAAFPYASDGINDIYEVTPEDVREDASAIFARLHPEDLDRVSEAIQESARTLETFNCEFRVVLPRQGLRWRGCQAQPERTEDGGTLWYGIISDITERKQAEDEIAHQARLRAALLSLPVLAETLAEKDLMQQGQELAEDLTGSVISFIHFVNPDGATIELGTWSRRTIEKYCHAAHDNHYPIAQAGIWADALRERRPVVFNDYPSYPKKHGLPEGHSHLQRLISVPVIENGRVVMMTGVGNKPEDYTERDINTVQLIAEAIHRLVQRKRTEAKLRQFSRIIEQAPLSIAITDLTGSISYANPFFCAGTGYSLREVIGQNPRVLKSGRTPPEVYREMWQTLTRGEVWRGELNNMKKSGEFYDELAVIAPVSDDSGAITHYVALKQDITERKAHESALRESEQRFRELFDLESDAILVFEAESGLIVQANEAAVATYGYSLPELLRLHTADITAEPDKTLALLATTRSNVDQVIKVPFRLHRKRDGTVFPVELNIRTFQRAGDPMVVAVVRDITEQVRARERLEHFNAELETKVTQRTEEMAARTREIEALLQSVPDLVLRARSDGTVLDVRPAKGATPLAAITVTPEQQDHLATLVLAALPLGQRALAENTTVALETELTVATGPLATELRVAPVGKGEFVVFARDISERKRFEAAMVAMLEKERQVSEMKTRFVAVTSHEFRTPMAAVMASADLLHNHLDRITPAKREELFARIASSLRRMTEMLDELLLLNRIEANRVEVSFSPLNLRDFTHNVIEEIRLGDRDAHRFEFDATNRATQVVSDGNLLHHILANLLSNAVRYSPPGTVITTRIAVTPGQVRVSVEDHGIGVPEADRERIFGPFERGSNVGTIKGSGLGLNIVKRMCGLLGAFIVCEAAPGGGSRFVLTLPHPAEPAPTSP